MAPARKKSKLSNENEPDAQAAPTDESHNTTTAPARAPSSPHEPTPAPQRQPPQPTTRGSWTESWRSKASPVAQVARHSISVDKGVSSESPDYDTSRPSPSQSVSKSFKGSSRKSIPLVCEATKVHATSNVSQPPKPQRQSTATSTEEKARITDIVASAEEQIEAGPIREETASQAADVDMGDGDSKDETASLDARPTSWFGWWSRPDDYGSDAEKAKSATKAQLDAAAGDRQEEDSNTVDAPKAGSGRVPDEVVENIEELSIPTASNTVGTGRSWFRLWSSTQNEQAVEEDRQRRESEHDHTPGALPDVPAQPETAEAPKLPAAPHEQEANRPKSSGWAFWSKDKPQSSQSQAQDTNKEVGELAVADTPSQSHPEAAQFNQGRDATTADKAEAKKLDPISRVKRGRADKSVNQSGETTAAITPVDSQVQTPAISQLQTPKETPESSPAPVQRGKKAQTRPNLILPSFRDTYVPEPAPGVVERLSRYIAQSLHIPGYAETKKPQYPNITLHPPKVKRAIAIGVHGYFPAALLQRVIGQPTGTSIRFSNYAAASIKQWCLDHQPEVKDVEVEKVALEGEGFIADRVSTLWKLLLNWLSHLRQADFILVACHSQGVPVATMLIAKLIQLGCLSPHVRVGICAMAGVNLGPFAEYKSRFFGGSALELFDFSDPNSKVSVAYAQSLELCLRHGVRITFVGSLDDQLVSLESSLHMPLSHPYVSRAVFIDGRLHTSNFLTHLVVFALKLRNLGVSDHGLIRELSGPLAGSLVGGEGHSRVYDDAAVYKNAIEFALETTDMLPSAFEIPASPEERRKSSELATTRRASLAGYPTNMIAANSMRRGSLSSSSLIAPGIAPVMAPYEPLGAAAEKNPFVLPWAVRGMLAEDAVKQDTKLQLEVKELVSEFESWRPTSKVLKDVRWRLEGVRSML